MLAVAELFLLYTFTPFCTSSSLTDQADAFACSIEPKMKSPKLPIDLIIDEQRWAKRNVPKITVTS